MEDTVTIEQRELMIKSELIDGIAMVVFFKNNGAIRPMLCTRNPNICQKYTGVSVYGLTAHQDRQKPGSHNISVIDLEVKELRSFNVERLITYKFFEVHTPEKYNEVLEMYKKFVEKYTDVMENEAGAACEMANRDRGNKKISGTKEINISTSNGNGELSQSAVNNIFNEL